MTRLFTYFLFLSLISIFSCAKDDDKGPSVESEKYAITATIQDEIFFSNAITQEVEDNLGWTLTTSDGDKKITIGTSWPVDAGTYTLSTWDPYSKQYFFATYTALSKEYKTQDNSGTLTIQSIRIVNNEVIELIGSFEFKAYSAAMEEIQVQSGKINYLK